MTGIRLTMCSCLRITSRLPAKDVAMGGIPEARAIVLPGLVEQDEEADKVKEDDQDGRPQGSCHCSMQNSPVLADWEFLVHLRESHSSTCFSAHLRVCLC